MGDERACAVREAVMSLGLPQILIDMFKRSGRLPLTVRTATQAVLNPDAPAVTDLVAPAHPVQVTWRQFEQLVASGARRLEEAGGRAGTIVVIALPNGLASIIATHAAWRLGATVVPLSCRLPDESRQVMLGALSPGLVIGDWPEAPLGSADLLQNPEQTQPMHVRLADPYAIMATGGSTGRPRLVEQPGMLWGRFDEPPRSLVHRYGIRLNQTQLVSLPLYHGFGFGYAHVFGLAYGHHLVITGLFDARLALWAMEQYHVQYCALVPTMMRRMARDPSFVGRDLSSIEALMHGAAPCPPDVKRAWISKIGADRVYEAYGATELSLTCTIRGDEWLAHPGSVGRPTAARIHILGTDGQPCPPGIIGEVYVDPGSGRHPPQADTDLNAALGPLRSAGDLGRVDGDGYLYLHGRRDRTINSGGTKISPEEIETMLLGHPIVRDALVRAVSDEDRGDSVEALVSLEICPNLGDPAAILRDFCQSQLPPSHVPRHITIVTDIERTEAGKLPMLTQAVPVVGG